MNELVLFRWRKTVSAPKFWSPGRYGAVVGAVRATNVSITGGGVIDGQGSYFWALVDANHKTPGTLKCSRPHLIEFENSTDISVTGLTLQNSPFWTTHFIYSHRIRASELTILAPATRGNTDGINPDSSTDVTIENCFISNGDDGIAIKSGLNAAGIAVGPSKLASWSTQRALLTPQLIAGSLHRHERSSLRAGCSPRQEKMAPNSRCQFRVMSCAARTLDRRGRTIAHTIAAARAFKRAACY